MKKHLDDGQLRAALDGELTPAAFMHLQGCAHCQQRKSAIHAQMQRVAAPLAFLSTNPTDAVPNPQRALRHFYQKQIEKEIPMFKKLFASTVFRFAAIAVLLIAATFCFPQTRALAYQLLTLFRVQQVAVLPLDVTGMNQLTGQGAIGAQMSRLMSSSITVTQNPGKPAYVGNAALASQMAGFNVRLPQSETASKIGVMDGTAFTFTIDRAKAQALLDETGRPDLVLPESIDGKDISVNIPASVGVSYGNCPVPQDVEDNENRSFGSAGRRYAGCIMFVQLPSPTISAPSEVNISELMKIGLEFTGMSSKDAEAYISSVDWTSTLVIPIPRNAATYRQVSVDGVTGTLIERPSDDEPMFTLIWVKDGMIYAVSGLGNDADSALKMANSLP